MCHVYALMYSHSPPLFIVYSAVLQSVGETVARERKRNPQFSGPRLDVIRTNTRPDSDSYIRRKQRALHAVGIECHVHDYSDVTGETELLSRIAQLNADPQVQAILVQFSLGIRNARPETVMEAIDYRKDVDGFHPINLAHLLVEDGKEDGKEDGDEGDAVTDGASHLATSPPITLTTPTTVHYQSCTPKGIMRLLREMGVTLPGLETVVVGRSRVVGLPMQHMLLSAGATVTCCHRHTVNLASQVRRAELVVVAAGHLHLVRADWIRPGAIVIDVGINHDSKTGRLLGGDVDFEEVRRVAGFVTPVPGGVGPLTIAMLAENVLQAALFWNTRPCK